MRFSLTLLATLAALTQAQSDFPSCIQDCLMDNPTSSTCTGDERGQDLADCTCDSLRGSGLLDCMSDCSPEDQTDYASILDGACKDELFPDAGDSSDDNDDSDDGPSQTDEDNTRETGSSGDDNDDGEDAASGVSASMALAAGCLVAALFM